MTITIPTGDLVGVLTDVLPFAWPDNDIPELYVVRLEFDGTALHAFSTDRYRAGWSQWSPDSEPEEGDEPQQSDLWTEWGSTDNLPWEASIAVDDAQELAKVYKLPAKESQTPLTVEYDWQNRRLTVKRTRDSGHTAHTMAVETLDADWPNLRSFLDGLRTKAKQTRTIAFNAKWLADFAKVRPGGPMELGFTTSGTALVAIGKRFRGAIAPAKEANGLRDMTGLVVAGIED